MLSREGRVSLDGTAPFVVVHPKMRLVYALHAPLDPKAFGDLTQLVMRGVILGFLVKGETALGSEVGVINNLGELYLAK